MMVLQDQLAQCASDLETCEEGRLEATRDSDNLRGEIESLKRQLRAAVSETGTALAQVAALKESEEAAFHSLKNLRSRNGAGMHSSHQVAVGSRSSTVGSGSPSYFKTLLDRRNRSANHVFQRRIVKKLKSLTSRRSIKMMFTAASVKSSRGEDGTIGVMGVIGLLALRSSRKRILRAEGVHCKESSRSDTKKREKGLALSS